MLTSVLRYAEYKVTQPVRRHVGDFIDIDRQVSIDPELLILGVVRIRAEQHEFFRVTPYAGGHALVCRLADTRVFIGQVNNAATLIQKRSERSAEANKENERPRFITRRTVQVYHIAPQLQFSPRVQVLRRVFSCFRRRAVDSRLIRCELFLTHDKCLLMPTIM